MDNNNEQTTFQYTYSAKEQAEIKRIREKYITPDIKEPEDKMTQLRRLDASVIQTAQAIAIAFGIIGALILGCGMSLCMTGLSDFFGMQKITALIVGIIVGVVGGVLAGLAYPVYNFVVKRKRKKLAPKILSLTNDLIK